MPLAMAVAPSSESLQRTATIDDKLPNLFTKWSSSVIPRAFPSASPPAGKYRCRGRSSALHHTSGQQQDLTNQWRAFCYKLQHAGFVRGFYARLDGEATTVHAKPKLFLSSGCAPWSSPSTTSSWSRKPFMLMVSQTFSHHRSLRNACLAGFSGLSAAASSNQVHAPKATHSSLLIAKHLKNASRPAAVSILARCSIRRW